MNAIACFLAVLMASQAPPPAPASGGANCEVTDNRCKAQRFERQAAQAASPSQRALYLYAAHRSYVSLHKETGEVRDLCEARRTFDQSLAVESLSAEQRANFEEGRAELEARERKAGTRCGRAAKRQVRAAALRSAESSAPGSSPPPAPLLKRDQEAPAAMKDESVDLLPVTVGQRPPRPIAAAERPTDASPAPTVPAPAPPRHGRPLVIAGGVTLGLGLSLVGLAGYSGGRAIEIHRAGVQLHEDVQGPPDDDARTRDAELEQEYRRMGSIALGTAIAGGVAVIIGTALVAVGGRRLARTGSSTAFVPVPGGLAFHARF